MSRPVRTVGDPLFVLGAMRSGTTHLRTVLHASGRVWMPDETQVLHHWLRDGLPAVDELSPTQLDQALAVVRRSTDARAGWRPAEAPTGAELADHLAASGASTLPALFRALLAHEADRAGVPTDALLAEKTPQNTPHALELASMFPDARFLGIVRDPRDVVTSLGGVDFGPRGIVGAARYWRDDSAALRRLATTHPDRVLTIRYRDLLRERERCTRAVTDFLGIELAPAMLTPWRTASSTVSDAELGEHHTALAERSDPATQVAKWRRETGVAASARQLVVEVVTADEMRAHGYDTRFDVAARLAPPFRRAERLVQRLRFSLRWHRRSLLRRVEERLMTTEALRPVLRAAVSRLPGCAPLAERPLVLLPGASAMIRAKDERENVDVVLDSIKGCFTEIVFVDNGSTDGTPEAVRAWAAANPDQPLSLHSYPHAIARCGPEHQGTDASSPHSLVTYYNWALARCSAEYVVKWDMDMVATHLRRQLTTFLEGATWPRSAATTTGLTVYVTGEGTPLADDRAVYAEPRVFPNHPLARYAKGEHWEVLRLPSSVSAELEDLGVGFVEVKRAAHDELDNWSGDLGDLPTPRKRLEFEVLSALAAGEVPAGLREEPATAQEAAAFAALRS